MADPILLTKAAATVLTDERARKAVGWVLVAILPGERRNDLWLIPSC